MPHALPREIDRLPVADGVLYRLPRRPLGRVRWVGIGPLVAAAISSVMLVGIAGAICNVHAPLHVGSLIFLVFALPFIGFDAVLVMLGLAILFGRSDVRIDPREVWTIERVGPAWWSRRRATDAVSRLEVAGIEGSLVRATWLAELQKLAAIRARCSESKDLILAWGYPASWMDALARDLAEAIGSGRPVTFEGDRQLEVRITSFRLDGDGNDAIEDGLVESSAMSRVEQPAESTAVVERHDAGITITLPPRGVWQGSQGLLFFSLLWMAVMAVITTAAVSTGADLGMLLFMGGFWLIGLAMMTCAVNLGRRQAIVDVVGAPPDAVLLITRKSLFGMRQEEYPQSRIERIHVGNSGVEIGDRPVKHLKVVLRDPTKTVGLLMERPEEELRWIASELRLALAPAAEPNSEPTAVRG